MIPSISIIIPTIGRTSLGITLGSLSPQLGAGDEVLVVGDGPQPEARSAARAAGATYIEGPRTACWGHAQRNLGMARAKGDYLAFMDDDDVYLPGGLAIMRAAAVEERQRPLIFRMRHMGRTLWDKPVIAIDNVSTQMFFFPNRHERLAVWGPNPAHAKGRGGDFCFARDTAALWERGDVVFRREVVAELVAHACGT